MIKTIQQCSNLMIILKGSANLHSIVVLPDQYIRYSATGFDILVVLVVWGWHANIHSHAVLDPDRSASPHDKRQAHTIW